MRPDDHDLDEEIRSHLAISIRERIDDGQDPDAARLAALREFGYVPATRDAMRRVWHSRWLDAASALGADLRVAFRSLGRGKGLAVTVAVTLALGIGANAAIFSVVRQVLLRPLVNRDADRLIYIRQSAPGLGTANTTFSVPEIEDLRSRVKSVSAFGDFSTFDFTMIGFGEPRVIKAGLVSGSYFDVMGLRPVLGRLITAGDDGPKAPPVAVLTYRFWSTTLDRDPDVIGKTMRLDTRHVTIVGVLEPSIPYPADTEIIANIVTSSHHLGATMVTERTHRMTELFGRLAPGATLEDARAELIAAHAAMMRDHADAYSPKAEVQLRVASLRDQITAPARPILLLLLAAAGLVFAIACSNVANLILARTVRRERELAVRAALGASAGALRRTLLAESLVLCGIGAALGVLLARPLVSAVAGYAARFSVRAVGVTVDPSVLWVCTGLAMAAAVVLAYVPRLPSAYAPTALALATSGMRITPGTNRRLRVFAITQIALSFVLLAGTGMILATLIALQRANAGFEVGQVLALDVPRSFDSGHASEIGFVREATHRIAALPGVQHVAAGNFVPWRDAGGLIPAFRFTVEGYTPADGEDLPHGRVRVATTDFFATLAVPLLAGRTFTDDDRLGRELVVIVSQSVAQRLFPNGDAVNRRMWWTDPVIGPPLPRRIVGVVADVEDEHIVPGPALTVYHPFGQMPFAHRFFVHTVGDPYAYVPELMQVFHSLSAEQPVERAATLADVRAQLLEPERLKAFVLSGFAGVALLVAVVGVAGVLAFTVSARTREFGVRLASGSLPRHLLLRVLKEGAVIVVIGIAAGAAGAYLLSRVATSALENVPRMEGVPLLASALVLMGAAMVAALMPAARASRVDVVQALRSDS